MTLVDFGKIEIKKLKFEDDFTDFCCDYEDDLGCNDFIHKENEAKEYQRGLFGITYVFSYQGKITGYVTLAMSSILAERLDIKEKTAVPLAFYPCLLIGRLAVANDMRHLDIGTHIANWATGVALELSERIGCRYAVLETKESKVHFYSQCGFQKGATFEKDRHVWMYKKIAVK
jgi:predicted GNAT family N-acyltransferase